MGFDFAGLLQQYAGQLSGATNAINADPAQAENDFGQVAQHAPAADIAHGVTEAFRSDQTPPFSQMVSQLFGRSDPTQRAGMLNQLLAYVNPAMLTSLAGGIGHLFNQNAQPQVTPQQAEQVTPAQVAEIAATAEQHNPGIVDKMGAFYAQHPTLVQALGSAALAIIINKVANRATS